MTARRRGRRRALAAALMLAASAGTACTDGDDPGSSTSGSAGSATSASVTSGTSQPGPSGGATPQVSDSVEPTLALSAEGLVLVVGPSARLLDFGATRDQVTALLVSRIGPVEVTDQPECGQGPRTSIAAGALSTLFDGDQFVGWFLDGRTDTDLTTLAGIGIGSTLAELTDAYEVSVDDMTLGPEFFARDGQFGGFLTGLDPDASVTSLHAGETCLFR